MPTSFSRSLQSLEADRFRGSLVAIAVGTTLLAIWIGWFFLARVALYEVSNQARLEVDREPYAVMSLVSGRVERNEMVLGKEVQEGDVLIELDASEIRFQIEEKKAEASGSSSELERLLSQIEAERNALAQVRQAARASLDRAGAQLEEAREAARFAEEEAKRQASLHEQGLVSRAVLEAAATERQQRVSAARAQERSVESARRDGEVQVSEKEALVSGLQREAAEIEAKVRSLEAIRKRLEHELSLHTLRAPTTGRIGDLVPLQVGEIVDRNTHLGTVVPSGEVRVVAEFAPHRALGRIQPGQPGKLRLQGFSWVQYGSVSTTVSRVGSEPQNGTIRVELALVDNDDFPVALSHGLPGTLEVEVERISPAALVLRAAGDVASRPVAPAP